MVRGQADYGALAAKDATASISDMGEVAARLGSIVTYDKRGDVVDFDAFEEPVLKWAFTSGIYSSTGILDSESAKSGSQSLKLTTTDVASSFAQISKYFSLLGSKRLGVELSFASLFSSAYLEIYLRYWTGNAIKKAQLRIDTYTSKLYVLDKNEAWYEVATLSSIEVSTFLYYTTKLVLDFDTDKYVRLLFGNTEYDISSVSFKSSFSDVAPMMQTLIVLRNQAATGSYCWIDDVIWTQAEP